MQRYLVAYSALVTLAFMGTAVELHMKDPEGRDRLVLAVAADGTPSVRMLDASHAVIAELPMARRE